MAGAGYKLFNTGDVLTAAQVNTYLMEQTVMVFADAAARTTALSGVVSEGMISYLKDTNAVEVYDGSNWVSSDDPNAIQNTIVDAKGDLIAASAADTPARLAVGNNGETLVANSSATVGLSYRADFAAGKNKIINGAFDIWQRGTSFSNPADGTFAADRFRIIYNGTGATRTLSQQTFTAGSAPVAGYEAQYFLRTNVSVAGSGNTYNFIDSPIEDVRTFANQTTTLSFWAKADTNRTITAEFYQNFGSGGSAEVYVASQSVSLTTAWQRFSLTFSIPSISGKTLGSGNSIRLRFGLPSNTTFTVDLWGVQWEAGSVATAFQTATGTLAGELGLCQRYYFRITANGIFNSLGFKGAATSTTKIAGDLLLPVQMRTIPSTLDYANLCWIPYWGAGVTAISAAAINNGGGTVGTNQNVAVVDFTTTGTTTGNQYIILANNNANAYIGLGAEL